MAILTLAILPSSPGASCEKDSEYSALGGPLTTLVGTVETRLSVAHVGRTASSCAGIGKHLD